MTQVHKYEGPIPEGLREMYDIAKVYTASVSEVHPELREQRNPDTQQSQSRANATTDSQSKSLYNRALDTAVADILGQAGQDSEPWGVEIVADFHVTRKQGGIKEVTATAQTNPVTRMVEMVPGGFYGTLDLTVEAIGYKRKTPEE